VIDSVQTKINRKLMHHECALSLVSIGVPTYNRPVELRSCLEALSRQTYPNLEIIVSDNCSPGNEVIDVVNELMARDSRIRFFRQSKNQGAIFNFQFVLNQALGDFFMWAGDDDHRTDDYVETLVNLLNGQPAAVLAFCDFTEVNSIDQADDRYMTHLQYLKPFTSRCTTVRLLRYFFQLEPNGKANLIYGLVRMQGLAGFDWIALTKKHGEYGSDMLAVFSLLRKGPLALSGRLLYRCTVGNVKHHNLQLPLASNTKKIVRQLNVLLDQLIYSAQYPILAQGVNKIVMAGAWPFKAIDIFIRIFLSVELKNAWRRLKKRFALLG
jgi:glycosyltransferase involved in cell wall biosynthesis